MYIYLNLYVFTGRLLLPPDGHLSQYIILKSEIKLYCTPFKQEICITVHTLDSIQAPVYYLWSIRG